MVLAATLALAAALVVTYTLIALQQHSATSPAKVNTLDVQQKLGILASLAGTSTVSEKQKETVLKKITSSTTKQISEQQKLDILKALK